MTTDSGQVRPFADVLRDIRNGQVSDEAAAAMQQLVAAVREHGKKGAMTLTLTVEPMKGNEAALMVVGEVTVKAPKAPPRAAVFFADTDHNLVRDDPRQIALPGLREVGRAVNHDNVKEINK
ncbi:hypothetical protein [Streptosporangium sp. NPDC049376]|uniref:hypothetical protein n=1 Tax=Streptosporangium sp. NPDC049376 TaxID=3366192 RepID=UPI0037B50C89